MAAMDPIRTVAEAVVPAVLLLTQAAGASGAQETGRVVLCHDPGRGIVQEVRPHECAGEIVDAAKASEIRERRRLERARALRTGNARAAPPPGRVDARYGTAFPVTSGGHFLTAAHVVSGCAPILLITAEGEKYPASLVDSDVIRDISLLRSELDAAPFAAVTAPPVAGLAVVAIGYPEEGRPRILPRIDRGTVRGIGDGPGAGLYIAAEIGLRRGNSGGPLLDGKGDLLGLVIQKRDRAAFYAATGEQGDELVLAVANRSLAEFLRANDLGFEIAGDREGEGRDKDIATSADRRVVRVLCGSMASNPD